MLPGVAIPSSARPSRDRSEQPFVNRGSRAPGSGLRPAHAASAAARLRSANTTAANGYGAAAAVATSAGATAAGSAVHMAMHVSCGATSESRGVFRSAAHMRSATRQWFPAPFSQATETIAAAIPGSRTAPAQIGLAPIDDGRGSDGAFYPRRHSVDASFNRARLRVSRSRRRGGQPQPVTTQSGISRLTSQRRHSDIWAA